MVNGVPGIDLVATLSEKKFLDIALKSQIFGSAEISTFSLDFKSAINY
jgi:hypothetical protein